LAVLPNLTPPEHGFHLNTAPRGFENDLPAGFLDFYAPLHQRFAAWQQRLLEARAAALQRAHAGHPPAHLAPSEATTGDWMGELPGWCADQRNQMTGPADDGELCVKMLNSGAPGVMLDLEDSTVNEWNHQQLGVRNILACLRGELNYFDRKRNREVSIQSGKTVIWVRVRGLHLHQGGIFRGQLTPASLWDLCRVACEFDPAWMRQPLAIYIPKSESAEEALWWREVFQAVAEARGWPRDYIRCMALVESHALAYQMEEFLHNLQPHIAGLNLGRWDYMASLIHYNLADPRWVLPDRNTIPHDVAFFQRVRLLMPEICHRRGVEAIGGMTALYPSREDPELNTRALAVLEQDKKNEAACLMDGAWTGHPDQNRIAVDQFPYPNQVGKLPSRDLPRAMLESADMLKGEEFQRYPDLRPLPEGVGRRTLNGTRAAIRTVIRYRNGVLNGKGASLLDGYMEDLATDRIYRLMIAQRMRHYRETPIVDDRGRPVAHAPELISRLFDEELTRLLSALTSDIDPARLDLLRRAREIGEAMVMNEEFNPF
jgi:malate synthase